MGLDYVYVIVHMRVSNPFHGLSGGRLWSLAKSFTRSQTRKGPQAFVYPTRPLPKTAVLVPWFIPENPRWRHRWRSQWKDGQMVRTFAEGWTAETENFAPASVAATYEQLMALRPSVAASLTHALVVLEREEDPRLTEERRDLLWQRFGLPVFEQVIGFDGELVATECEMHQGLHIESGELENFYLAAPRLPVLGNVQTFQGPCPCGRTTPRLHIRVPQRLTAGAS